MAKLDVLLPRLRIHLEDLPNPTAITYLKTALKQFCFDCEVWEVSLGTTSIVPSLDRYLPVQILVPDSDNANSPWTLPPNAYLLKIKKLLLNGRELERVRGDMPPSYRYDVVTNTLFIEYEYVKSNPTTLEVIAILTLSESAPKTGVVIPDFIVERHAGAITSYAAALAMALPNKPWSNNASSKFHMSQYKLRTSEVNTSTAQEGTTGSISLAPIPF